VGITPRGSAADVVTGAFYLATSDVRKVDVDSTRLTTGRVGTGNLNR